MHAKFYITTAIPYVNAPPHIGHALEFVQGDAIARFHRFSLGQNVLFLSGSDENAIKNMRAAQKANRDVQSFVDENAKTFACLAEKLNVQFDVFQKGSDTVHHFPSCQELWIRCRDAGMMYKKSYSGLYCVGCESFYSPGELTETGACAEHPGKVLEEVFEDNWFFRLSSFEPRLRDILTGKDSTYSLDIIPEKRKREMLAFLDHGLEDISISRSNERANGWGVPVPGDPTQRMYVWFDALNIYQSGIGYGWDTGRYDRWWPADVHVIGKGIARFHAIYWPAFLLAAGLALPKKIFVHEYFTVNGQKMSKTLGNVVDPFSCIDRFGADALRYYFLSSGSPFQDGDFSLSRLKDTYNADLANGLGNLISRVAKLCEGVTFSEDATRRTIRQDIRTAFSHQYEFDRALQMIWERVKVCDVSMNTEQPWKLQGDERRTVLFRFVEEIRQIGADLLPFLPDTAAKITAQFSGSVISSVSPLFPRID